MTLKSTRDILGKPVLTQDGREVGHVEGIEFDLSSWQAKTIELKLRRDALESLHIKRPLFGTRTARLGIQHVSGVTDSVVLKTSVGELGARLADLEDTDESPPQSEEPSADKKAPDASDGEPES